jgi:hypothetical protein
MQFSQGLIIDVDSSTVGHKLSKEKTIHKAAMLFVGEEKQAKAKERNQQGTDLRAAQSCPDASFP